MSVVGAIRGAVIELDGDARYVNVWADDPSLFSEPRERLIGRSLVDVLGVEVGTPLAERVIAVHRTGIADRHEYALRIGGKTHWFVSDAKRCSGPNGDTVVVFRYDVTERRAAEEALRLSEERYRLAAEASNDILYDWDILANAMTWSAALHRVLKHDRSHTVNGWLAHIHPDDMERVKSELGECLAGAGRSWSVGYRVRRGDGTYAELLDRGLIVRDAAGRPIRMVGSLADVTQLNRLQAQLVQSDRLAALGTLAAGVGHEINNPLCYVLGNLDVALDAGPFAEREEKRLEEEDARAALVEAKEGATRIVEIVKTLRLFSRSEATISNDVDVEALLERSLRMAESDLRHRARIVRVFGNVAPITANASRLGQVCLNLIVNAAQAIPLGNAEKNEICITTGADDNEVWFAVSDTGPGISPEHIDRIFDPFFTTKPVGAGTGIGLSVCMNIVQSMGGTITVARTEDERTVFTVTLPRKAPSSAAPRENVPLAG